MSLKKFSHLTILLADDHRLYLNGLISVLRALEFGGEILEARNGKEVVDLSRAHAVHLYILDYKMPILNGYEASAFVMRENSRAKIIMISMYNEPELISAFHKAGIQSFLTKESDPDLFGEAITTVLSGGKFYQSLDEAAIPDYDGDILVTPTKREREVIQLLAKGLTNQSIADNLGLSHNTVETYRSRLLNKANVKNTSELLHYVHRMGLI